MTLRGKRVLARSDENGQLVQAGGRVEIRYSPRDGKAYRASATNLEPLDEGLLPDDHCAVLSAEGGTGSKAKKGSSARSAGARKPAGASGGGTPPTAPKPGEVLAYCDGACSGNPGPAGVGVVVLHDGERWELSEYLGQGTNTTAEYGAAIEDFISVF
jgi:ribonuclease HI